MNTASSVEAVGQRLDEILAPPAADLVAEYFDPQGPFAGDTFDTLGSNDWASVDIDDLLAITLLDVNVGPLALRRLLGDQRDGVSRLLAKVKPEVDLWEADNEVLGKAAILWNLLTGLVGVGPVTAGKVLARKRPRLIPIVDSVVEDALQCEAGTYWATIRGCLTEERRRVIEALRPPGIDAAVSTIRLMDVAIWMRCSQGKNAKVVRAKVFER